MPLTSLFKAFKRSPKFAGSLIRIGVVGAGRMGQHHVRHLARHRQATLVGVADNDLGRAEQTAKRFKTKAFAAPADLIGKVDAVVIVTPTPSHFSIGKQFLEAGISCLIEKPLASSTSEANELIALAEKAGRVLQVGHIERFNPAVTEAAKVIQDPQFIEVNRLGPYDPRVSGIGVVLDLMIHDLDIVLFLVGKPVTRVEAFGAKVLSDHEDIAKVRLHFEGGCIADLSASRVSIKKYRTIRIFQKNAYLSLDYAAPKLTVYRKKSAVVKGLSDIQIFKPKLLKQDPLNLELTHFLDCVRERRTPKVTGQHGRDALELAGEVLAHLQVHA